MIRSILKPISVFIIIYLQSKYKYMSLNNEGKHGSRLIAKLQLIQAILYFFKTQFGAWGYFHPSCIWSSKDEEYFKKLFPQKDFKEIDIVVWHNPEAVTYYRNKIWVLSKECPPAYEVEIKKTLIGWNKWN